MKKYDFIAIGGGNAGLTATALVRNAGKKVALIDRGPIGGLCSLNGCNPQKVLVRSTEVLNEIRRAQEFGIDLMHDTALASLNGAFAKVVSTRQLLDSIDSEVAAQSKRSA